jgi:glycosyltransferase involved in cell wall biosynthesis
MLHAELGVAMHTILYPVNSLAHAGAEQQLLALVRGLNKDKFHPIVAPLFPDGVIADQFRAVPDVEVIDLNRKGKFDLSPLWKIGKLLRSRQVEIIQPFLTPSTFYGLIPALVVRTPIKIVTERCGVRKVRGAGYKTYRTIEDRLTRFADSVVPNSGAGCDILQERGIAAEKIRVIYNGLDPDRLVVDEEKMWENRAQTGVPEGGKVVGILATLSPAKDHATFLRAASMVADNRAIRFAIIGDGPLRGELERQAKELGIADRVTFFGFQRRVADYVAACDLLVSSSRDNEGCSNSILEAMALDVPVVATDVGGNGELVQDGKTGYLIPVGNDVALAAAIERVFNDPARTGRLAATARQMTETRFSLERMVADYEALYMRLLAQRAVGRTGERANRRTGADTQAH